MALAKNVYRALESVVGSDNISEEPVILEGYTFTWLAELDPKAPSRTHFLPYRPAAVVLPGSTEEVQVIVKLCNRYQVKYKAFSTGYGSHAFPGQEGVVVVDLRRMNRILEIDEKNKYAVVEPYCAWAQLSAEAFKVGLATTPIQAGAQASVLANLTSCFGMNWGGTHGGYNSRNVLGVEWVLPTGEVLKLGPPDSWFTSDGPGPSLRGVMRGNSGALGGLGIFTKCAVKLHDWPGPPKFSVEPSMPPLNMMMPWLPKEAPKYCACDIVSFSDWEKAIDFMYEACGSEITYIVWKFGGVEHAAGLVHKFKGFEFLAPMIPQLAEEFKHPVIVMQLAQSQEEFDYQQKVLADIVAETGGVRIVPSLMERLGEFKMGELSIQELISRFMAAELMLADDTHLIFLYSGFCINAGYGGTMEPIMRYQMRTGRELKAKYIQKGTIVADGTDGVYLNIFDNGAYTYTEVEFEYDQANEESVQGAREFMEEEKWRGRDEKYGFEHSDICAVIGGIRPYEERVKDIAERSCGFHVWQERIKRALDPHDVCDRSHYGVGVLGKELKID